MNQKSEQIEIGCNKPPEYAHSIFEDDTADWKTNRNI